jgi:hypothetical protein
MAPCPSTCLRYAKHRPRQAGSLYQVEPVAVKIFPFLKVTAKSFGMNRLKRSGCYTCHKP